MDEKPKKTPSLLKRDEHNNLVDPDEGRKLANELLQKYKEEQKKFDKDNSMHFARTGKRDIVVHIAITVLGQVDGVNIIGEQEKEVGQWCFRLNAKHLPFHSKQIYRPLSELANLARQAMMRVGAIIS